MIALAGIRPATPTKRKQSSLALEEGTACGQVAEPCPLPLDVLVHALENLTEVGGEEGAARQAAPAQNQGACEGLPVNSGILPGRL